MELYNSPQLRMTKCQIIYAQPLRARAARSYNNSTLDDWWNSRPALADLPSDQWLGSAIDDATKHTLRALGHPGASAWYKVHQYAMSLQAEAK